jgi:hypothetical protein
VKLLFLILPEENYLLTWSLDWISTRRNTLQH